jgi:predicted permease
MISELALAMVLLIGAGALLESFWRLQNVDPGFRPDHLLTMRVWLPKTKYRTADAVRRFYDDLLPRLEQLPGVQAAGGVSFRPFLGMAMTTRIDVAGRERRSANDDVFAGYDIVTPHYLRLLQQPLVQGRDIADDDSERAPGVVVVNETMARQLWPGETPIGKQLQPGFARTDVPWAVDDEPRLLTVVGVAADIKEFRLNEQPRPVMYISQRQFPSSYLHLVVRTSGPPQLLTEAVEREIRRIDAEQPISDVATMDAAIAQAVPRFDVSLLGVYAGLAWLLSIIGVYSVTAHAVARRGREIGIRMALGASASDMLVLVLRETCAAGAIGAAIGVAGAFGAGRLMSRLAYGVAPANASAVAGALIALVAALVVASLVPARRATLVEPVEALRIE